MIVETGESTLRETAGTSSGSGRAAFQAWVEPHLPSLGAVAVRQVGREDAADVVQNTLLRAWQRWSTFDDRRGQPRAWLMGVLLDQSRRHRTRARPVQEPMHDDATSTDDTNTHDTTSSDRLDVEAALRRIPHRQREVVALYYLADLPVADVAALLGISSGSVKSALSDARAALRQELGQP